MITGVIIFIFGVLVGGALVKKGMEIDNGETKSTEI